MSINTSIVWQILHALPHLRRCKILVAALTMSEILSLFQNAQPFYEKVVNEENVLRSIYSADLPIGIIFAQHADCQ